MILVTGGTGLVGTHLLYDLVSKGEKVRALKRASSDTSIVEKVFSYYSSDSKKLFSAIEWVEGDILDTGSLLAAMEGVANVYHCAGFVSYDPREAERILRINAEGTANIVNTCIAKGIKKLCHVSSVAAFGDVAPDIMVTEELFWKGCARDNYYSISKYNAEREAWRGTAEGLDVVIVNPAVIVGPGNWNISSCVIFKESYKGLKFYPNGTAGYVDVRDVSKAMIQLVESDIKNERFILSPENRSLRDFANKVHEALGRKRPSINVGRFLLGLGWRIEKLRTFFSGKAPVLTKTIAHAVHSKTSFSSDKIRKQLNFQFIPLERSIQETAALFLKDVPHRGPHGQKK